MAIMGYCSGSADFLVLSEKIGQFDKNKFTRPSPIAQIEHIYRGIQLKSTLFVPVLIAFRYRAMPDWTAPGNTANTDDTTEASWQIIDAHMPRRRTEYRSRLRFTMEGQFQFDRAAKNVSIMV